MLDTAPGSVGLQLVLPGGLSIATLQYSLSNGDFAESGSIDVSTTSTVSFVIGGVPSGVGYTISLTATTTDGSVTCNGVSAPFSVSNREAAQAHVPLVCERTGGAGGVVIGGNPDNCAVWNTLVANPATVVVGGTSTLTAAATAPDVPALTFSWFAPAGTLGAQVRSGTSDTITFTCPATPGPVTLTMVVSDGPLSDGGTCPVDDTTGTVTVACVSPSSAIVGTADAGTDGAGGPAGDFSPCTAAGQTSCVPCTGNASGVCTPTEAAFVAHDIAAARATPSGFAPGACYTCLIDAGCIDDTVFADTNLECGDLSGTLDAGAGAGTAGSALCLDTIACVLATSCATSSDLHCFCGTAKEDGACQGNPAPGPVDGACAASVADGLGVPQTDGTDVARDLTNAALPAGRAMNIFACARAGGCTACLD
jgi:hypothetical protein